VFTLLPYSLVSGKFVRYMLPVLAVLDLTAAVGIVMLLRRVAAPAVAAAVIVVMHVTAFVLESVNRTITVAFQFVPMWLGVDEAGTGLVAAAIGISPAAGVTLALARRGRIVLWTAVGLAFWWPSVRATFQPSVEAGSGIDVRYARSGCGHSE
jgi:hypothetical protein